MNINQAEMFAELRKLGVKKTDIQAIYLFGSHYWGYAGPDSDIDLYVILHQGVELNPDYKKGVYSFHYLLSLKTVAAKIKEDAWPSYYVLKYASELLYGERVELPEYDPQNIIRYLVRKQDVIENLPSEPVKAGYLSVIIRVFFINHYFHDIHTFRIDDFRNCVQLSDADKTLCTQVLAKMKARVDGTPEEKLALQSLAHRLDAIIKQLIQK